MAGTGGEEKNLFLELQQLWRSRVRFSTRRSGLADAHQYVGDGSADTGATHREYPIENCSCHFPCNHFEPEAASFLTLASRSRFYSCDG